MIQGDPELYMQGAATLYPLAPSPVLDVRLLSPQVTLNGYVSVRQTLRRDTVTTIVHRGRGTVQVLPAPFAALRLQVDFTASGFARADTVPAIVLTDAALTYTSAGLNVLSRGEHTRLLLNAIYKSEPGVFTGMEFEAQLLAIF